MTEQERRKKYKVYIGIDTGCNTGIAIWHSNAKSMAVMSVSIHRAMEAVRVCYIEGARGVFVRVEDARKRKWIPRQKSESAERGRREGAGSVKRDAKIWEDFLTDLGVDFEMVAPKNNKTKLTAESFKKITGYQGKTNEHSRDAAMMVFGM